MNLNSFAEIFVKNSVMKIQNFTSFLDAGSADRRSGGSVVTNTLNYVKTMANDDMQKLEDKTGLPQWAVIALAVISALVIFCILFCVCKKCIW